MSASARFPGHETTSPRTLNAKPYATPIPVRPGDFRRRRGGFDPAVDLRRPGSGPNGTPAETLVVYCAAGLQPPVAEIIKDYEAAQPVTLQTQYAGSGTLLSEIRVAGGDLFIAADKQYLLTAREMNLVREILPIATQTPVIVVPKGNPKKIAQPRRSAGKRRAAVAGRSEDGRHRQSRGRHSQKAGSESAEAKISRSVGPPLAKGCGSSRDGQPGRQRRQAHRRRRGHRLGRDGRPISRLADRPRARCSTNRKTKSPSPC